MIAKDDFEPSNYFEADNLQDENGGFFYKRQSGKV